MYIKLLFWVNSIFFLKQARGYSIYHMYLFHTHTEKALEFLDHHLQHIIKSEKFCVTDANDFIKKLKKLGRIPEGAILVTADVVGLYPSISYKDNLNARGKRMKRKIFLWKCFNN